MIDMEQARILDFGRKEEEQKAIANIKQTLINLKAVAEEHTKRLFDMKVENERIVEENDSLRKAISELREDLEFIACEGMDDGDFYAREDVTEGTIAMAKRARSCLARLKSLNLIQ